MSVDGSTKTGPGGRIGDGRGSPSPSLTSEKTLTEAEIAVTILLCSQKHLVYGLLFIFKFKSSPWLAFSLIQ